jgi:predicted ribosome quality control (RQC) complex YloA/Tae2 family protein
MENWALCSRRGASSTTLNRWTSPSEAILALKPVTFHYKSDKTDTPQFGLIAEKVAQVNPDLVARDKNGEIYTVRYDQVNAMLNEFLKEHEAFVQERHKVERLETTVATLVATVKEQATQIEKVSAQLEASKPASRVVNNP